MRGKFAIVGMGVTQQGRRLGVSDLELRRQALELALEDASLPRDAVDGYIHTWMTGEDHRYLGLSPTFSWGLWAGGATAGASLAVAAGALATGQAEVIACVVGLAPTSGYVPGRAPGVTTFGNYSHGYAARYGLIGAAAAHALHARWHMDHYDTTSEQLGAVAVTQRDYALTRPGTQGYGKPITLEDHQNSRMIADPLRRLDVCQDTDGGVALLVTTAERAREMGVTPIYIQGFGSGQNIRHWHNRDIFGYHDDIQPAMSRALKLAGKSIADMDFACLYDPFTISVIMQLEAYGFCKPGHGGPFVAEGAMRLDGAIPTNMGGGQLSGFYAAGFTPFVEAVRQLRGDGGANQVASATTALVSSHGLNAGIQNSWSHQTTILGLEP